MSLGSFVGISPRAKSSATGRPIAQNEAGIERLIWLAALLGVGLRLWQYFAAPAMWLDELALMRNVVDRPFGLLLTQPLAFNQIAPKGLLAVEKLASLAFGPSDYVFRLFPLICGLAAVYMFQRVARLVLTGFGIPAAVALFAVAGSLVDYTSRAKQYSSDVAAAVLLLWLVADLERNGISASRAIRAAIAGLIAALFSQAAVLMLAALGTALALRAAITAVTSRPAVNKVASDGPWLIPLLLCWAATVLAVTAAAVAGMQPDTRTYMQSYWSRGLAPHSWSIVTQIRWPVRRILELLGHTSPASLGYPVPALYLLIGLFGAWVLWRTRRDDAALVAFPVLVALAAGFARQYPFDDRMILFILPGFFLTVGAVAEWMRQRLAKILGSAAVAVVALIVGAAILPTLRTLPPYRIEDVKPVLAHLRDRRLPGDSMDVYYGAGPAVQFYGAAYGIQAADFGEGGCHKGDTRQYLMEVDAFRGKPRVWVVITGAADKYGERDNIVRYLDAIGSRKGSLRVASRTVAGNTPSAEVLLYDLSDPGKLASTSAASFPVIGRDTRTCQGPYSMVEGNILPPPATAGAMPQAVK